MMNKSHLEKFVLLFSVLGVSVLLFLYFNDDSLMSSSVSESAQTVMDVDEKGQKVESKKIGSLSKGKEDDLKHETEHVVSTEEVYQESEAVSLMSHKPGKHQTEASGNIEDVILAEGNPEESTLKFKSLTLGQQAQLKSEYEEILQVLMQGLDEKDSKNILVTDEIKRKAWKELGIKYQNSSLAIAALEHLKDVDKEMFARGLVAGLTQNNPQGLIDELLGKEPPRNDLVEALKKYDNQELGFVDEVLLAMSPYNAIAALEGVNHNTLKEGTLNKVFAGYEDAVGLELGLEKLQQLIGNQSERNDIVFHILNQKNNYSDAVYQASLLDENIYGKYQVMGRLMQRWSEQDLPQALSYFEDFISNTPLEQQDLKQVLISWKYGKNSSDEHEIKKFYTDKIFDLYAEDKLDEAKGLLSALMEHEDFNPNVIPFIIQLSNREPEATKQWLSEFKTDDFRANEWKKTLYANWGRNDPAQALEAARTLPIQDDNEMERAYAYSNIAIRLAQHEKNHEVSPEWIKDLPEGFVKDRSIAGYALGYVRHSRDPEAEYALKKQFQMDEIDVDTVFQIVQESNLDQNIKDQIVNFR